VARPAQRFVVRAEEAEQGVDVDAVVKDIQEKVRTLRLRTEAAILILRQHPDHRGGSSGGEPCRPRPHA
jgi:hypothetical protein